jgi:uncharacterized membrane protein
MAPQNTPSNESGSVSGGWLGIIRGLATVAFGISAYLLWASLTGSRLPGCGLESSCDAVLHSRWAYWLGVPVSLGALVAYGTVLWASFRIAPPHANSERQKGWLVLIFMSLVVLGAAVWFVGLQALVIKAFCPYCMTAHSCGALMAVLVLSQAPLRRQSQKTQRLSLEVWVTQQALGPIALAALVVLAVLVAGQVAYQPRTFEQQPMQAGKGSSVDPGPKAEKSNPVISARQAVPQANSPSNSVGRILRLHGDVFQLDLGEVPVIGHTDAPYVMLSLFDYTCQYCRVLHQRLMETHRTLSNELAIVSLPVPLEMCCNSILKAPIAEHSNACTYAQLGLAVWRADRSKQEAFDDWIFSFARTPSTNEAREQAIRLIGSNALAKAIQDPWIDRQIQQNIRIYHTNYLRYRKGQLPQLIIGTNLFAGTFRTAHDLCRVLSEQLGLPLPEAPQVKN